MATDLYTLELAEEHIAELRGQVDRLNEVLGTFTGGTIQVTDPLVATDPVNGGPETWHTLGTLAGYTVSRGRFRLTPEGELELDVQATAGGANAASVTFSVTMPGAYIPAQVRRFTMETGRAVRLAVLTRRDDPA